ncbi:MAG: DUF4440 domain-containing protein [Robiginitomaculum sp.]|nr:MAG: DUF4440 domain-containing protein [Robiginitomaculum sp.]
MKLMKNTFKTIFFASVLIVMPVFSACDKAVQAPSFQVALDAHLATIAARDLGGFMATLTKGDTLPMIFPDGSMLQSKDDVQATHAEWFGDTDWRMGIEHVSQVVGSDVAVALLRYSYRDTPEGDDRYAHLALTFQLQDGEWRLVMDQNTRITQLTQQKTDN